MSSYTEYHRAYYLQHKDKILEYNRELRSLRKRLHLCRECGKKDAYTMVGRSRCAECVKRETERNRKARGYKPREDRISKPKIEVNLPRGDNGYCWQCNKQATLPGKRLCEKCYEAKCKIAIINLQKARGGDHPWSRSFRQDV